MLPREHRARNFGILLLLAVYLFIHLTNVFFVAPRRPQNSKAHSYIIKGKTKNTFSLQRTASSTANQNTISANRIVQYAALFFIVLLFVSGFLMAKQKLFPPPNQFLPDHHYSFLIHRSIQIWSISPAVSFLSQALKRFQLWPLIPLSVLQFIKQSQDHQLIIKWPTNNITTS